MAALSVPATQSIVDIKGSMLVPSAWHCHRNNCFLNVMQASHMQTRFRIGGKILHNAPICARKLPNSEVTATPQSPIEQIEPDLGMIYNTEGIQREFSYLFRIEIGGIVKVSVAAGSMKYVVHIEVSSLPESIDGHSLVLSWSMLGTSNCRAEGFSYTETPFVENPLGRLSIQLEFSSSQVPFYLSFLVSGIRTHRKTNFCVPVGIGRGYPLPLGVSTSNDGSMNFSLFSRNAESVVLCLYEGETSSPTLEIELDPYVNRTGDIWHVSMESIEKYANYGYRCKGEGSRFNMQDVLLDPYTKMLSKLDTTDQSLGSLKKEAPFDWSGDVSPRLPMEKLVVYRLNVGRFTQDESSGVPEDIAGTFTGVTEKLQHFIELGVNAVLLEPIFPFDEEKGPYFPHHLFTPMNSYGPTCRADSAIKSMKEMVKSLHAHGIEVLLEVAFTHTSEGGDAASRIVSFRGIDNSSYYIVGFGMDNVLNCNYPVVQQLILDSLCHWVTEFHIDGFCFIDSSSLLRGSDGNCLSRPPLVEAIAYDPLLSGTKLIADCWSPTEMLNLEILFPHWKRWAQMNSRFCSGVRSFLRGEGLLSVLATRLCGSGDLFSDSRGPAFSFNYIASNFGLPLLDLVSFSGEDIESQLSWNCGDEGPTNDDSVLEIRLRQIRNFLFILFVSLGVPVLNMGDECGYSTGGSPAYSDRQPMDWDGIQTRFGMQITQFITFLSALRRRRSDLLQRKDFLKVENLSWHGGNRSQPKWEDLSSKFLAMMLKAEKGKKLSDSDKGDLFICFNAGDLSEIATLPRVSEGSVWVRLVDTSLPFPAFFSSGLDPNGYKAVGLSSYEVEPHTCTLFEAKRKKRNLSLV